MDVLEHPALRDGMPTVVLEALAPGVRDMLHDGKNERMVSINDISYSHQFIQEVLSDKAEWVQ
jgi:hypothetical protein